MFALGRGAAVGLTGLKHGLNVGKHSAIGGALGGGGSLFRNALDGDGDGDRFDASDTLGDAGVGALLGGALGGIGGGLMGRSGKIRPKLGKALAAGGGLGALFQDYEPADASPAADIGAPGIMGAPAASSGGTGVMGSLLDFFDGPNGIGAPPNGPTMTLADYMDNPRLNSQVDGLLAQELNPLNRQVAQIQREKAADLQSNQALGQDLQNQMGHLARENAQHTKSIQQHADVTAQRADEEADKAAAQAELGLAGNEHTQQDLREEQSELEAQLSDRRMADAELLKRLGVAGSDALSEIAGAEVQQTGQNAIKIRTDATDAITETRGKMADVQAKRPTLLGQLSQGAFDSSIAKHRAGLEGWQLKLQAASARSDAMKNQMTMEAEMQGAGAPSGLKSEHLMKPSGLTIMNENTGHADAIPYYATIPVEEAVANGISAQAWEQWQPMVQAVLAGG